MRRRSTRQQHWAGPLTWQSRPLCSRTASRKGAGTWCAGVPMGLVAGLGSSGQLGLAGICAAALRTRGLLTYTACKFLACWHRRWPNLVGSGRRCAVTD
jgi:hypothetical protein